IQRMSYYMTKIISTAINKGGVGKTTLISNIVGSLSPKKETISSKLISLVSGFVSNFSSNNNDKSDKFPKILVIDTDGQVNLGPENIENTLYDVLVGSIPINDAIIPINENIDMIPSNSDMSFIEFDILPKLSTYKEPFKLLKNALDPIKDDYDYIFIDTPPAMGLIVGNVLCTSTDVIIPYVPEVFAVNGLIRIQSSIEEFSESFNPNLNIAGVIGMMVDSRTTLHQDMLQQARTHCFEQNIHMFNTVIPKSIRFANSNRHGIPAVWSNEKNHLIDSYFDFLDELINRGVING